MLSRRPKGGHNELITRVSRTCISSAAASVKGCSFPKGALSSEYALPVFRLAAFAKFSVFSKERLLPFSFLLTGGVSPVRGWQCKQTGCKACAFQPEDAGWKTERDSLSGEDLRFDFLAGFCGLKAKQNTVHRFPQSCGLRFVLDQRCCVHKLPSRQYKTGFLSTDSIYHTNRSLNGRTLLVASHMPMVKTLVPAKMRLYLDSVSLPRGLRSGLGRTTEDASVIPNFELM